MSVTISIPNDLRDFLASGSQLRYDFHESSVGEICLKTLDELTIAVIETFPGCQEILEVDDPYDSLEGIYRVAAVDLVSKSEDYEPTGLFCWIPALSSYASVDSEHGQIWAFPNVDWTTISAKPAAYLDDQWLRELGKIIYPWLYFPFEMDDGPTFKPYPQKCDIHGSPISERMANRHKHVSVYQDQDVDQWLVESRERFPFAGVPLSENRVLCCSECASEEWQWARRIEDATPILNAVKSPGGYIRCPRCNLKFRVNDEQELQDGMHTRCAQKICVVEVDET